MGRNATDFGIVDPQADQNPRLNGLEWVAASASGQALLNSIFDALPVAIYTTDPSGYILFYNSGTPALLGREVKLGSAELPGIFFWPNCAPMPYCASPMATALRERRAVRGAEVLIERPDGTIVRFLAYPTPLFDGDTLIGSVNMLVELSERHRATYFEQRLATIVECSEDAIISKDLDGTITTWNRAAERLFGYTAAEAVGRPITMLIPDDRKQEEVAILASIRQGTPVARYETWRQCKDGSLVPIALTVSPLRDTTGRVIGASKIARDITDQVRMREHQTLVLNEMNHRVKNVLAVAGGLVGLSARSAEDPKIMAKAVQERLGAYSRAHELTRTTGAAVARGATRDTTLHTLINAIVAPYLDEGGDEVNVVVDGDDITIDANATASLALVLHEFATNAAKYGALSATSGRIRIVSKTNEDGFELMWTERGGPAIAGAPSRQGFGSVLATKTVEGQLNGSLHYDWQPEGVVIRMKVPREKA